MSVVGSVSSKYYSGFNPLDIGNCALWLDAADTSTLTLSGSSVTQWRDKSGNGYNFTQSDSSKYPVYNGSGGGISFTGNGLSTGTTTQFLDNTSIPISNSAFSIFAVARGNASQPSINGYNYLIKGNLTSDGFLFMGNHSSKNFATFTGTATWNDINSNTPAVATANNTLIMGMIVSGSTLTPYYNGNVMTTKTGTTGSFSGIRIGDAQNGFPGYTWNGIVYEILIYNIALSGAQRQQIEGYLARKWGLLGGGGVQSITTFIPTSISGCGLWLDAADSSSVDLSGTSVTTWRDKSGNNRNFTLQTGFSYPTIATNSINSNTTISFTGPSTQNSSTSQYLTNSTFPLNSSSSGYSIFVVARQNASRPSYTGYNYIISAYAGGAGNGLFYGTENTGGFFLTANGTAGPNYGFNDLTANSPNTLMTTTRLTGIVVSGSTLTPYMNGTAMSTKTGTVIALTGISIGDAYAPGQTFSGQNWNGNIAEVLIFNTALSTTDRQNIEGYLARKWGLTESLPSTHPYALRGLPSTHPYYSIAPVTRAFAPIDIPGCALWLDAADSSTLTLSGSSVTQWNDKSGNGWNATAQTGSTTYSNNGVVFTGAQMLQTSLSSVIPNQSFFCVASSGSNFSNMAIMSVYSSTLTTGYNYTLSSNQQVVSRYGGTGVMTGTTFTQGSLFLYNATVTSGGSSFLYANGVQVASNLATPAISGTNATVSIGAYYYPAADPGPRGNFTGTINEILLFSNVLTTTQRQQVEAYLARKWGLIGGGMQTISTFNPTNVTGCQLWLDGADSNSMTTSSTTTGVASLTRYVTTSPQNVLYYGTLTSVSSLTGGTCIMNGNSIGASGSTPTAGFLAPSASSGQWYAYCIDGIYIKVVKIQFVLTGSTLTVQGLSAGYTSNTNNYISTTNSGSTNDTYYAGYTSMSIATSSTAANYGVQSFKMNLSSSTTISIVNQWRDKASNVAFTSSNNPEYLSSAINGVNAINLHANAFFSNSSFTLNAPFTIIGVGLTKIQNGGQATLIGGLTDQYLTLDILASAGTSTLLTWYGYPWRSNNSYVSTSLVQNTATMLGMTLAGAAFPTPYVNGTALSLYQSNSGTVSTITGITVGRRTVDYEVTSWSGSIGELLIFNSVLSTTNRQTIEGYLALKWGLQSSLPSTHPYALRGLPSTHPYVYRLPATTVFNPRQISGCALWLDAADPATITLSGTNVTQWNDKSGNGRNTTTTFGNSVLVTNAMNGFPAVYFNSTAFTGSISHTGTQLHCFVVATMANNGQNPRILSLGNASQTDYDNPQSAIGFTRGGTGTLQIGTVRNSTNSIVSFPNYNTPFLAVSAQYANTQEASVNGANPTATSTGTSASFNITTYGIGRHVGTNGEQTYIGYIGEMIVYTTYLSTSQRQQVEGYLAWKWGLNGGYSPSIAPFTPTSVTGCQLWLDAADSSTLTLSGTNVTQWNDKSGNGRNATGVNNPTYNSTTNGINFVRTSSQYMTLPDGSLPFNDSSYSYFFIFTPASTVAGQTLIFGGSASVLRDSFGIRSGDAGTGTLQTYWIGYDLQTSTTYNLNVRNFAATYYTSGGSRSVWINFTQGASDTPGVSRIQTAFNNRIGRLGTFSDYLNGQIHEIIVYNSALSTTNRQQIEGYLANKWGLTGSLPSSHPYGNRSLPNTHPYKVIKP